jgi:hypothetical protein
VRAFRRAHGDKRLRKEPWARCASALAFPGPRNVLRHVAEVAHAEAIGGHSRARPCSSERRAGRCCGRDGLGGGTGSVGVWFGWARGVDLGSCCGLAVGSDGPFGLVLDGIFTGARGLFHRVGRVRSNMYLFYTSCDAYFIARARCYGIIVLKPITARCYREAQINFTVLCRSETLFVSGTSL